MNRLVVAIAIAMLSSSAYGFGWGGKNLRTKSFSWTNVGVSVDISSSIAGSATGSYANGTCTYSFNVGGVVCGPYQKEDVDECVVSTRSSSLNGHTETAVTVNDKQVYPPLPTTGCSE